MSKDKEFQQLQHELQGYKGALGKAADTIIDQEVSEYPIFVVHQHEVAVGIPMIQKEEVKGNWSVNASSLEEFVGKNLIDPAKVDGFKEVYKDPEEALCLFVLSELGATFIFLPRANEKAE
jgi:hypothetical protein